MALVMHLSINVRKTDYALDDTHSMLSVSEEYS